MKTIKTAIKNAAMPGTELNRALNGLAGCPVGGWPETEQALRSVREALPFRSERKYTASELVNAVMGVDHADRYVWKCAP